MKDSEVKRLKTIIGKIGDLFAKNELNWLEDKLISTILIYKIFVSSDTPPEAKQFADNLFGRLIVQLTSELGISLEQVRKHFNMNLHGIEDIKLSAHYLYNDNETMH
jgi:hypothetical protein